MSRSRVSNFVNTITEAKINWPKYEAVIQNLYECNIWRKQLLLIYLYKEEIKKPCYFQIAQKVLNRFASK